MGLFCHYLCASIKVGSYVLAVKLANFQKLRFRSIAVDSSDQLIETPTLKYQKIPISGNRACPPCWLFRGIWLVFLYRGLHWLFFCVNMYMYVYIPAADVFAHLPFSILHLAFLLTLTLRLSPFFTDTYVGLRSADTYVFLPLFLTDGTSSSR